MDYPIVQALSLEPLDTLLFRDGRPFDATNRVSSGLPQPQALAGALRTAILAAVGFNFQQFARARRSVPLRSALEAGLDARWKPLLDLCFRGPWPALSFDGEIQPLLPVPAILGRSDDTSSGKGRWQRAAPLPRRLANYMSPDRNGALPLWWNHDPVPKHPGGFLTLHGIKKFLDGGMPDDSDYLRNSDVYDFDSRTGIKIEMNQKTSEEGQIYGINFLALRDKVGGSGPQHGMPLQLYAEVLSASALPLSIEDLLTSPIPFGGEGRYVSPHPLKSPAVWPQPKSCEEPAIWLLATPGIFRTDDPPWVPDAFASRPPIAAAANWPVAVSGWDVARGAPKPTRFAAPAGSVYFVENSLPVPNQSLCGDEEDVAQGWGFALQGVWTGYERQS